MTSGSRLGDLEAVERERLRAIVEADESVLWSLHDPAFLLCSPGGTVWDRSTYVGGLCDGSVSYSRFEPVTPVEVLGDTDLAVVRCQSRRPNAHRRRHERPRGATGG